MASKRHEVMEWHKGFAELAAGKPFDVRKDDDYQVGDFLVVRECKYGEVTGQSVVFAIDWIARGNDHHGAFEALIPEGVAVLGLTAAAHDAYKDRGAGNLRRLVN